MLKPLPTLKHFPYTTLFESDAGLQTVNLSGISAGGEESQILSVTAASSDTGLIPPPTVSYTSPSSEGHTSESQLLKQLGSGLITVTMRDAELDTVPGNAYDD